MSDNDKKLLKHVEIEWLKEAYFSDPDRRIYLKKGEILLRPQERNTRLFLILKGTLIGYLEDEDKERFEIFRSAQDNFVGAYSYFSDFHQSYSTVEAAEDAVLAYIEADHPAVKDAEGRSFAEHFLPVIVNEIYIRQLLARRMNMQNQAAIKRLYQVEKMASLGRMAAGLAHELNNAIGVIQRNSEWISERAMNYIRDTSDPSLFQFFEKGLQEGQRLSTSEIRKQRRILEKNLGLKSNVAKQLATAGITEDLLTPFAEDLEKNARRINYFYETGLALHDMLIAANHAARVVRSVKELGASSNPQIMRETDLNQTLREAVSLLKRRLNNIKVDLQLNEIPTIMSNPGELTQIWVNLIKNACESMNGDPDTKGELKIKTRKKGKNIVVQINDNGPGIPPDILPLIFQPNVTTKVQGLSFGLGLGLPIVERLVHKYSGVIDVKSNKGNTTFSIEIPYS